MTQISEPAKWFAVRCIFSDQPDASEEYGDPGLFYEERITLWSAADETAAIALAEADAQAYAAVMDGTRYVGLAQCYWLDDEPGHGIEVFSLIRESKLAPNDYLDRFFDTRSELQRGQ